MRYLNIIQKESFDGNNEPWYNKIGTILLLAPIYLTKSLSTFQLKLNRLFSSKYVKLGRGVDITDGFHLSSWELLSFALPKKYEKGSLDPYRSTKHFELPTNSLRRVTPIPTISLDSSLVCQIVWEKRGESYKMISPRLLYSYGKERPTKYLASLRVNLLDSV